MTCPDITVFLRNGETAVITGRDNHAIYYPLQGYRIVSPKDGECWTNDGHWRDDCDNHPFDIVHVRTSDGQIVAMNQAIT